MTPCPGGTVTHGWTLRPEFPGTGLCSTEETSSELDFMFWTSISSVLQLLNYIMRTILPISYSIKFDNIATKFGNVWKIVRTVTST